MIRKLNQHSGGTRLSAMLGLMAVCIAFGPNARAATGGVPYVEQLSPVSIAPGSASFTLTVTGANFVAASAVYWNGAKLTTTFVSSSQLTATIPATNVAASGTALVTVVSPGQLRSNQAYFGVTLPTSSLFFRLTNQSPSAGSHPNVPVFGDFNGNGILDLAASNENQGGAVAVFIGNGNGSFGAATDYPAGMDPEGMGIGDFDGDGRLDLATANMTASSVTVLLGAGDGTFPNSVTTPFVPGTQPYLLGAADFNGDGKLDLAVACQNNYPTRTGFVYILLGNGDGTFQPPVQYGVGGIALPEGLAVADLNNDGFLDLAVTDFANNEVWIFFGKGDGTFASPIAYATGNLNGGGPGGVVANDLNGDGHIDLAVTDFSDSAVSILLNSGSGTFPTATEYPVAAGGYFLTSADFNGDGILDLAATSASSNTFSTLLGNGDGTFAPYASYTVNQSATSILAVAAADITGNGRFDFVFTESPMETLAVLLQSAQLLPSPSSLSFGNQTIHTEGAPMTITLENTGSAPLDIDAISSTNPSDFPETNTCGTLPVSLWVGQSCTVSVTFTPGAEGPLSGSISILDNVSQTAQLVPLTGTGLAPEAALSPASLGFGNQFVGTGSTAQTATLSNTGNAALSITSVAVSTGYTETNNCGSSLAANSSCAIMVTFKPGIIGAENGTLTVTDNSNGTANSTQTAALTGTGIGPVAGLAPLSLTFASQFVQTTSAVQKLTLSNTGSAALTITGIVVGGSNSTDFAQTNTCGTSVAAGGNCSISVSFTPKASGARSGTITVTDNSNGVTGSVQTAILSGTGIAPVASVTPASLPAFAGQLVGTTSGSQTVTLSNTGTAALTISTITTGGTDGGDFAETNTCGTSVAAGANCAISVTFKPTASGSRSATLSITDNSGGTSNSVQTVTLTGTGTAPTASVSPASLPAFAGQLVGTTSGSQTVTLSNTGTAALTINSITIAGANGGDFGETNACGSSLAAGANCSVSVTFKPSATGSRSGSLVVTDNNNASSNSTQTLVLAGTGTAPVASVSPATLPAFAGQLVGTKSAAQTVTLSNTGSAALSLTSIALSGTNSADFAETNTCGTSVAAGANCTISVTFAPAAIGTFSATLSVTDNSNAVSGSAQTVNLSGTGTAPAVELSRASLTFAGQNVETSSPVQSVTVTNTGTAALAITSIVATGDFTLSDGCGSSLAAGANCAFMVTFKPVAIGSRTGGVTLTDGASPGTQAVSLSGTGLGAQVSLSGKSLTFSAELAGATSVAQTVTLTNTGNAALAVSSIAASGDFTETNTCGSSVAAGASCPISVIFKPTAGGTRTGSLTVADNAVGGNPAVTLSGTGQDFSLTASSGSASVSPGQRAAFNLSLTPQGGFNLAVSLSCSGAPSESTCSVSPASVTPSGSGATAITVNVSTTAASHLVPISNPRPPIPGSQGEWLLIGLLGFAGMTWLARRKPQAAPGRLRLALVTTGMLVVLALGMAACGGGGSVTTSSNAGTPAGSYPMTVTGTVTSGSVTITHTVNLTLTVQ